MKEQTKSASQVSRPSDTRAWGFAMVVLAAALWGTDGVFRRGLALEMAPASLVFWEHVILVAITAPILRGAVASTRGFGRRQWFAIILIGAGASAIATALFTTAFRFGDPTTPLLLQKLQPVLAILAARVFLGERLSYRFVPVVLTALVAGWLITFANPLHVVPAAATAGALAVGAAALWGMGTVLGRYMTEYLPPRQITTLRFAIGLPTAAVLALITGGRGALTIAVDDMGSVVLLALIPGLVALSIYYRGLQTTPASLATVAELAFPLSAITLNRLVFGTSPTGSQWLGVLMLSGLLVSVSVSVRSQGTRPLGVYEERRVNRPGTAGDVVGELSGRRIGN